MLPMFSRTAMIHSNQEIIVLGIEVTQKCEQNHSVKYSKCMIQVTGINVVKLFFHHSWHSGKIS
jgi:hypothetical protein